MRRIKNNILFPINVNEKNYENVFSLKTTAGHHMICMLNSHLPVFRIFFTLYLAWYFFFLCFAKLKLTSCSLILCIDMFFLNDFLSVKKRDSVVLGR